MSSTTRPAGFDLRAARTSGTELRPNTLIARSDSLNTGLPSSAAVAKGAGRQESPTEVRTGLRTWSTEPTRLKLSPKRLVTCANLTFASVGSPSVAIDILVKG